LSLFYVIIYVGNIYQCSLKWLKQDVVLGFSGEISA